MQLSLAILLVDLLEPSGKGLDKILCGLHPEVSRNQDFFHFLEKRPIQASMAADQCVHAPNEGTAGFGQAMLHALEQAHRLFYFRLHGLSGCTLSLFGRGHLFFWSALYGCFFRLCSCFGLR